MTLKLIIALVKVILNHKEFLPNVFCFILFNNNKTFLLDRQVIVIENKDLTSLQICFQYLHLVHEEEESEVIRRTSKL